MADLLLDTLTVKLRGDISSLGGDIGKMEGEYRKGFANIQNAAQQTSRSTAQSFSIIGQGAATAIGQGTRQGGILFDQFGREINLTSETVKKSVGSIGATASTTAQSVLTSFKSIAGSLGIAFGAAAFVGFGKQILDNADHLSDLADNTELAIGTLIGLKRITDQTGVSIDSFAHGILIAQKNLGEIKNDADPAAKALKELGLSLEEMRAASSEEFLQKLITALGGVTDQGKRLALQTAIMSRGGLELNSTLSKLARDGLPQVSDETAHAYENVGKFKDALAVTTSTVVDFFTTIFSNIAKVRGFGRTVEDLKTELKRLEGIGQQGLERFGGGVNLGEIEKVRKELEKLEQQEIDAVETEKAAAAARKEAAKITPIDPEKLKSLTEGLRNQLIALQAESIALNQGETAGLRFKLTQEAIAAIGKNIPPEIKKQIDAIISLSSALALAKIEEEALASAFESFELRTKKSTDTLTTLRDTVRNIDLAGLSEGAKAFADSDKQFDDLTLAITRAADALEEIGELSPRIAKDVNDALNKIDSRRSQARLALNEPFGFGPGDDEEIALGQRLQANAKRLEAGRDIMAEFTRSQANITTSARVFGASFDANAASIDNLKKSIDALINEGFTELDPRIQDFNNKLTNLEGIKAMRESFENVFDAITSGIDETLKGVLQNTSSFGDAMKNLARNILLSISNELNKTFILNPLKDAFKSLLPTAPGVASGVAGLVPNIQNFPNIAAPKDLPILDISKWTVELVKQAQEGMSNLSDTISQGLTNVLTQSEGGFTGLFSSLGSLISDALSAPSNLGGGAGGGGGSGLLSGIGSAVSSAISWIGSFFEQGGQVKAITAESMGIKPLHFATGGEVPAILHQGEFVIRKSAVNKIGIPTLEKMNLGIAPQRFDTGGFVVPRFSPSILSVPRYAEGGMAQAWANNMCGVGASMINAQGRRPNVSVQINGDITPRQPNMTRDDVIKIMMDDADNDGPASSTLKARLF